ncbi:hypothetical protein PsorP6_007075 [Peronosclerospora sorghi]|uniref:Uncharacterized protein n=1 Tax=Peronosclerospora sorghi TaxID=230839 RepID=A0ACC0W6B4_9STRA|nr:hypothetical protein PsorP6_007075 [Peronosclerospora sorghi]
MESSHRHHCTMMESKLSAVDDFLDDLRNAREEGTEPDERSPEERQGQRSAERRVATESTPTSTSVLAPHRAAVVPHYEEKLAVLQATSRCRFLVVVAPCFGRSRWFFSFFVAPTRDGQVDAWSNEMRPYGLFCPRGGVTTTLWPCYRPNESKKKTRRSDRVLATEIDAIVHNGADVNLVKPYAVLKSVNVLGTQKVLRLAVTNGLAKTRVKPVHYISTGAILPSTYSAPKFLEVADLSNVYDQLDSWYAQSKWVSEQMCHEAAQRGLPGCVNLGSVPDRSDWFFDMTPVDYASRAIVHFAASRPVEALGQTLLIQKTSLPVKRRLLRVLYCCNSQQEVGNDGFYGMEAQSAPRCHHRDCSIGSDKVFDSTISSEQLQTAGISCPSVNRAIGNVHCAVVNALSTRYECFGDS